MILASVDCYTCTHAHMKLVEICSSPRLTGKSSYLILPSYLKQLTSFHYGRLLFRYVGMYDTSKLFFKDVE